MASRVAPEEARAAGLVVVANPLRKKLPNELELASAVARGALAAGQAASSAPAASTLGHFEGEDPGPTPVAMPAGSVSGSNPATGSSDLRSINASRITSERASRLERGGIRGVIEVSPVRVIGVQALFALAAILFTVTTFTLAINASSVDSASGIAAFLTAAAALSACIGCPCVERTLEREEDQFIKAIAQGGSPQFAEVLENLFIAYGDVRAMSIIYRAIQSYARSGVDFATPHIPAGVFLARLQELVRNETFKRECIQHIRFYKGGVAGTYYEKYSLFATVLYDGLHKGRALNFLLKALTVEQLTHLMKLFFSEHVKEETEESLYRDLVAVDTDVSVEEFGLGFSGSFSREQETKLRSAITAYLFSVRTSAAAV